MPIALSTFFEKLNQNLNLALEDAEISHIGFEVGIAMDFDDDLGAFEFLKRRDVEGQLRVFRNINA